MTGAIIKKPFDTIIPVEQAQFFPSRANPKYLIINKKIKKNNFIRFVGSDFKKSEIIIKRGEIINSQHILAFKMYGITKNLKHAAEEIGFPGSPNIAFSFPLIFANIIGLPGLIAALLK